VAPVTRPARGADAIDRAQAARILAVHVGTVDRMIRRGVLSPARRFASKGLRRADTRLTAWPHERKVFSRSVDAPGRALDLRL